MLIVIKGQPHSGKSTLLRQAIQDCGLPRYGFVTEEVCTFGQDNRIGFDLVSSDSIRAPLLARANLLGGPIDSPVVPRYQVDLPSLNTFIKDLRDPRPEEIAYIGKDTP